MEVEKTTIEGLLIIKPEIYFDRRGHFTETYSENIYKDIGIKDNFVQDNLSHSKQNILRGLHYQLKNPQGKLVRVVNGKVFDVAVDIRQNSKTYGKHFSIFLDDVDFYQLYIPPGVAHGFCVISDEADFEYKCTDYYYPADQHGVAWNDPDLNIKWPVKEPILSSQDKNFLFLRDVDFEKLPKMS